MIPISTRDPIIVPFDVPVWSGNQCIFAPNIGNQCTFVPNVGNQCIFVPNIGSQCTFVPNIGNQCTFVPNVGNQCTFVPNIGNQCNQCKPMQQMQTNAKASGGHLGGIWETWGPQGSQGDLSHVSSWKCSHSRTECKSSLKLLILLSVLEGRYHQVL